MTTEINLSLAPGSLPSPDVKGSGFIKNVSVFIIPGGPLSRGEQSCLPYYWRFSYETDYLPGYKTTGRWDKCLNLLYEGRYCGIYSIPYFINIHMILCMIKDIPHPSSQACDYNSFNHKSRSTAEKPQLLTVSHDIFQRIATDGFRMDI